jgi:hypothetical protein
MLTGGKSAEMPLYKNYVTDLPGQIATLRQRVAAEADATAKARLQTQLQTAENNAASQAELNPTPPNVTLRDRMTLYRGGRKSRFAFLDAHTRPAMLSFTCRKRSL